MPDVNEALLADAEVIARSFSVVPHIHPQDHIYGFIAQHPSYPTQGEALQYYFSTGRQSAEHLKNLIREFHNAASISVLEFASGYGCVSRHLANVMPEADIVPCDIHPTAIDFLRDDLCLRPMLSAKVPEELGLDRVFDVVFALSFFSHMPKDTWGRWLRSLSAHTADNGLIIFTTHGLKSRNLMGGPTLDPDGFWFNPNSEQLDLDAAEYGTTITTFDYVYRELNSIPDIHLVKFQEGFWWGHQDVYILSRGNRDGAELKAKLERA